MKKNFFLFGAVFAISTVMWSCSKQEETPRNYYGVQPTEAHGTPKEAYYAFFGSLLLIIFLILWLLKKMSNKK
jgi:flagellar biogenesis protein FliO